MNKTYTIYKGVTGRCLLAAAVLLTAVSLNAQSVDVSGASLQRSGSYMTASMSLDLAGLELAGNRAAVLVPVIVNGADSLALKPVGLYGRTRWYQYLRSGDAPLGGYNETSVRYSERPDVMAYSESVPYAEWMNGSSLVLLRKDYGCCRNLEESGESGVLASYKEVVFSPAFRYIRPDAQAGKSRELSGRAYVDFPVNRTELLPNFRGNASELAKIVATIDSVRNDNDITVTALSIKGFASPEGSYANNERLAKGRTEALKRHVSGLYHFEDNFIRTDYEPEDWAGLREWVQGSGIENKAEILALIDGDLAPDAKDNAIKSRFPEQYRYLLNEVYPGLRHSEYRIEYTIRSFSDVNEIRSLLSTQPQKLSLNEMYVLAQTLQPGSDEYNNVFETAVRMYPDDETANLNAANAAMGRGDLQGAERYLNKAGTKAEATYARGMLAALRGDYAGAETLVRQAGSQGLSDTQGMLDHLQEVRRYN